MNVADQINSLKLDSLPHLSGATSGDWKNILTVIITILGAISVLFVVIGGMRYILSQGDATAVGKAKGTIVYAVVGLVIAIAAEFIVAFVLGGI